jgi:hypothetical protein
VADSFHTNLKWLGVGIAAMALVAIITNFIIINGKGKGNQLWNNELLNASENGLS